jgi:hypothetical protein
MPKQAVQVGVLTEGRITWEALLSANDRFMLVLALDKRGPIMCLWLAGIMQVMYRCRIRLRSAPSHSGREIGGPRWSSINGRLQHRLGPTVFFKNQQ